MKRRDFLIGASAIPFLKFATGTAAAQGALPDYYPADYGKLIEATKAENRIVLYTNTGRDLLKFALEDFAKRYPWITVDVLEVGGSESIERYLAESSTGTSSADLIFCDGPGAWVDLGRRNETQAFDSPEAAHVPEWATKTAVPGMRIGSVSAGIFIWNKQLLAEAERPKTFADMVTLVTSDPERFKGKITTYGAHVNAFGYGLHFAFVNGHGEQAWKWYEQIGPLTRLERQSSPMAEKIIAGEYLLGYFGPSNSTWNMIANQPELDAIYGWGYIGDGTPMLARGAAVTAKAKNVNSAHLFLDYLHSRDGQLNLGKNGMSPFRPDITTADNGNQLTLTDVINAVGQDKAWIAPYDEVFITGYDDFTNRFKAAYQVS